MSLKYKDTAVLLREAIRSGQIQGKLKGERELAEIYQVSRVTIRKALAELEAGHLVYRVERKGVFAGRAPDKETDVQDRRIAFILFGKEYMSRFDNVVFTEFSRHCEKRHHRLIFSRADGSRELKDNFAVMARTEQLDLVILCGSPTPAAATFVKGLNIPVILLGGFNSTEPEANYDQVSISYYQWAYRAARYLLSKGRTRIAMLCPGDPAINNELNEGYRAALEENDIVYRSNLISVCDGNSAMHAMNQALSMIEFNRPEALIAAGDTISAGVIPVVLQSAETEIAVVAFNSEVELTTDIYPVAFLRVDAIDAAGKLWKLATRRLHHPAAIPTAFRALNVFK
ncbi:MAG: GntR family transcriptional regulator [Victivallales bacterium]|nr:GntR family transcriptional regulator [Victivallales bacterium]